VVNRARTRLSKLLSIDSADRFGGGTVKLHRKFRFPLTNGSTRQLFISELELLIIACVRTAFVRGKGGVFVKNREVFVRKRDKTSFNIRQAFADVEKIWARLDAGATNFVRSTTGA
jgi:hypothetical protein